MKIKVYYRKNLKMSPGKLAAQVGHAVLTLDPPAHDQIVVLEARDRKFFSILEELDALGIEYHTAVDAGITEVKPNTITCVAFVDHNMSE